MDKGFPFCLLTVFWRQGVLRSPTNPHPRPLLGSSKSLVQQAGRSSPTPKKISEEFKRQLKELPSVGFPSLYS